MNPYGGYYSLRLASLCALLINSGLQAYLARGWMRELRGDPGTRPIRLPDRAVLAIALTAALAGTWVVLVGPVAVSTGRWWSFFRNYYAVDQLTYAAISTNVVYGLPSFTEPFTATGHLYWPSAYYQIVGLLARAAGWTVPTALTVVGITLVSATVVGVGLTAYGLSGRAWAPVVAVLPVGLGTFSAWVSGQWLTQLKSYAVLWGPFASLYPLNGEVAGLQISVLSGMLLLLAAGDRTGRFSRSAIFVLGCVGLGLANSFHSYAFIEALTILLVSSSVYGLIVARRAILAFAAVVGLCAMFLIGPLIASAAGNLAAYAAILPPVAPGLLVLARSVPRTFLWSAAALVAGCSPQVILVLTGFLSGEPFISYRQASSAGLGVPVSSGALAALPLFLVCAALVLWAASTRDRLAMSVGITGPLVITLLGLNDVWGFLQEPFRLWIGSLIIAAFLLVPLVLRAAVTRADPHIPWSQRLHGVGSIVAALALMSYLLAAVDVVLFWQKAHALGVIDLDTEQYAALRAAVADTDALIAADPCTDPALLKVATGARVAFYNPGTAWPKHKDAIERYLTARSSGNLNLSALQIAEAGYLVTRASCRSGWPARYGSVLREVRSVDFPMPGGKDSYTLWSIPTT